MATTICPAVCFGRRRWSAREVGIECSSAEGCPTVACPGGRVHDKHRCLIRGRRPLQGSGPDHAIAYGNLAQSYFLTGNFVEALKTLQAASQRKLTVPRLLVIRYNIAALTGDQE